jgi:hypothetical protein
MGIQGVLDMISLVWLEAMGVQHGWGKGIQERNSPASLPWVPPGNSAEIGNWCGKKNLRRLFALPQYKELNNLRKYLPIRAKILVE